MRVKGKIIAVTGAGSGIGKAAAQLFAKEGAVVLLLEKDEVKGREVEQEIIAIGGHARLYLMDISEWNQVQKVFCNIEDHYGGIDVLYNNASVFWGELDKSIDKLDVEIFEKIIRINLFGMMYCSKASLPLLRRRGGGSIINTSSSCGIIGVPGCDAYSASKGAVNSLTKSMAVEFGPENIRTNCIAPAAIYTPMIFESDLNKTTFNEQHFLTQGTPLRRWGTANDIANIALFLASDESSYMNGAILVADGGITIS
ncbi:SDR family NAD(P)-dependent oxidoreductase [Robinsoniella peoriensis]|uniref:SDR family NAD(P)-dependent oxidoreductase n=1 Tax=Robinsoniella peoriensis TaxID=180332 RepID=UPI0005C7BBA5|nr:glucose 1-dehydrogenase [Robinsoniella peoriensis]